MTPILVILSASFQCRFFLTLLVSTQVCAALADMNGMVTMGFLTYCLSNAPAISLPVVAVTIDTVIAVAILVVCINFTLSRTGFSEAPVVTMLPLYFHPNVICVSENLSKPRSLDTLS